MSRNVGRTVQSGYGRFELWVSKGLWVSGGFCFGRAGSFDAKCVRVTVRFGRNVDGFVLFFF